MKTLRSSFPWLFSVIIAGCTSTPGGSEDVTVKFDDATADAAPDAPRFDVTPPDTSSGTCRDTDGDGLSDDVEGAPRVDSDRDGTPDYMDPDSDNDGFSDRVEADRSYAMYDSHRITLACGNVGDNCDGALGAAADAVPNFRDLDSDNDGLTDREESAANTDPCTADTDGDGASDLIERAAMSNPRDRASGPPSNSLYVVLPYYPAPAMGMHEFREFSFSTRIREADVFFLVDNSASMEPVIDKLRTNLRSVIVPGIRAQIPDIQMGVGSFDSMPVPPQGCPGVAGPPTTSMRCTQSPTTAGDYTLWIRQRVTADVTAVQSAFDAMRTIDQDTMGAFVGADLPECQTEAAFELIEGTGVIGHETDALALRSVRNARDTMGNGWVPAVDPARDCGSTAAAPRYGWGCFNEGRVPIVVLASDAAWYDGCDAASPLTPGDPAHNCAELVEAFNRRGAFFIGVDVGDGVDGRTYRNAAIVSRMTRTLDGMGRPIVFGPGATGIATVSTSVVDAIALIAGQTRQDITTRVVADPMAMGLPTGRTTASFIKAVVPVGATPEMPEGYDRRDMTTFYNVSPTARVVFRADFYNDFMEGGTSARLFNATIEVIGRGGSVVDTRPVFIVVPAQGGGASPG